MTLLTDNLDSQINTIEVNLNDAKKVVERKNSLQRLLKNQDFKEIFLTDYLQNEPARIARAKVEPSLQSAESQKALDNQLLSIGHFYKHMQFIEQIGTQAEKDVVSYENEREELLTN